MPADRIRATAVIHTSDGTEPAPGELVAAMVAFEERYGGLWYPVLGPNGMELGLDGNASGHRTPFGLAFGGILDGDWTWGVDVLLDGSTAMGPGAWPYRLIDRSVDQRLERHALSVAVRGWSHRTFTVTAPSHVPPLTDERDLPPLVPEATGPAERWWLAEDEGVAVQATLWGWPPGRDVWTVRWFARDPRLVAAANPAVFAATIHETVPATSCTLCDRPVEPGRTCVR